MSTEGTSPVQGASLNPEDWAADEWAEAALRDRLPRLRAMAAEWQKTVGTVSGLFGVGALFNADTAVRALDGFSRTWFAGMAISAFLAAGGSIVLASLASQSRLLEIPPDVAARRHLQEEAFIYTRRRLTWSRRLAGLAIMALLASFLFRWFG
jgi:hypothetical protein